MKIKIVILIAILCTVVASSLSFAHASPQQPTVQMLSANYQSVSIPPATTMTVDSVSFSETSLAKFIANTDNSLQAGSSGFCTLDLDGVTTVGFVETGDMNAASQNVSVGSHTVSTVCTNTSTTGILNVTNGTLSVEVTTNQ